MRRNSKPPSNSASACRQLGPSTRAPKIPSPLSCCAAFNASPPCGKIGPEQWRQHCLQTGFGGHTCTLIGELEKCAKGSPEGSGNPNSFINVDSNDSTLASSKIQG